MEVNRGQKKLKLQADRETRTKGPERAFAISALKKVDLGGYYTSGKCEWGEN